MIKKIIPGLLIFCSVQAFSQSLSINTTGAIADASAMLDVTSNTKGLLIPRMSRTERGAITSPAIGLLIFQNAPDSIGLHYYDGSKWTWMFSNSNSDSLAWKAKGNTGTNPTNHFLGTTDNTALVIKTNNTEKLRVTSTGVVGIGTSTPNSSYGYAKVEIASEGYLAPADLLIRNAVNHAGYAPGLTFQHARGTLAAPLVVSINDYLGSVTTMNYDGSNYIQSAGMDMYADAAVSTGIVPGRLHFYTMNSFGSYTPKMTIKNDGKVGIGTSVPSSLAHISEGNFLVTGTFGSSNAIEVSGTGTKMFFNPRKAAFRAGNVSGTQWDDANIGNFSVGMGFNASAKTDYSISIGDANIAETNAFAVAIGRQNRSTGFAALAMGHFTQVSGDYASAIGLRDTVSGYGASALGGNNKVNVTFGFAAGEANTISGGTHGFAAGNSNTVTAFAATALGILNTASGSGAFAAGSSNTASGSNSTAVGSGSQAKTSGSIAIGEGNIAETGVFAAAIGRQNHSTGFASLAMGHFSEATGDYSVSIGLRDTVSAFGATGLGGYNKVSSAYGFAAGFENNSSGSITFVAGRSNYATGNHSAAFGFEDSASADQAFTAGSNNTVKGKNSAAFGSFNYAPSYGEVTLGNYATQYTALDATAINTTDRVFTIGNGTGVGSRSDALVVLKNGYVGIGNITPGSNLTVNGSIAGAVTTTTGSLTLTGSHYCVIYTGGAGNTFTLPAANSCTGRVYIITNHGTTAVTTSIYRIANATTTNTIAAGVSVQIISDGTEWRKIN